MPTLTPSAPASTSALRRFGGNDVAGDDLLILPRPLDLADHLQHVAGMAVRGIDDDHVDARFAQRFDALQRVRAGADRRADPQRTALVFRGARKLGGLLEVLDRDHALQVEVLIDDQHLLDAMLVQQREHLVLRRVLAHGDQPLLRRHDRGHRRVELGLEAQVAVRDDADRLGADDDRHAGDVLRARQLQHFADGLVGRDRDRLVDHAAFELLDPLHFARLGLDAHVLVDDADAAFLRDGDREARFGDRVHGGGQDRQIQADRAGELRAEVGVARQEIGVCRDQEHVVEGECFLENAHGRYPRYR